MEMGVYLGSGSEIAFVVTFGCVHPKYDMQRRIYLRIDDLLVNISE